MTNENRILPLRGKIGKILLPQTPKDLINTILSLPPGNIKEENKNVECRKMFQQINEVHPQNYELRMGEMQALLFKNGVSSIDMMYDAFRYGFLKGQRGAKAAAKRKAVKA